MRLISSVQNYIYRLLNLSDSPAIIEHQIVYILDHYRTQNKLTKFLREK